MQFCRRAPQSRDKPTNCFPTEAFLVVTEASQTLDTNTGHTSSGTAKAWQLLADNHLQMASIPPVQALVHSLPPSCFKKFWVTVPTNPSLPIRYWLSPFLFFSLLCMYVCVAHRSVGVSIQMCEYMCLHTLLHRCAHVQNPQSSAVTLDLIHWVRVSGTNPELSNTASLSEPACPRDPCLILLNDRWPPCPTHIYAGVGS